jgi:general L-amino acid transport system substrate-binding protein
MRWNGAGALALVAGLAVSLGFAQPAAAQGSGSATLDAAKTRAQVLCGISGQVPGFSLPDSQGVMRGLDADTCRAIAAAAVGDATKVKFVPTTTQNRFTALQSGEVDLLARTTTWTLSREGNLDRLPGEEVVRRRLRQEDGRGHDLRSARNQHGTGDR